jgi:hypothetical protein
VYRSILASILCVLQLSTMRTERSSGKEFIWGNIECISQLTKSSPVTEPFTKVDCLETPALRK